MYSKRVTSVVKTASPAPVNEVAPSDLHTGLEVEVRSTETSKIYHPATIVGIVDGDDNVEYEIQWLGDSSSWRPTIFVPITQIKLKSSRRGGSKRELSRDSGASLPSPKHQKLGESKRVKGEAKALLSMKDIKGDCSHTTDGDGIPTLKEEPKGPVYTMTPSLVEDAPSSSDHEAVKEQHALPTAAAAAVAPAPVETPEVTLQSDVIQVNVRNDANVKSDSVGIKIRLSQPFSRLISAFCDHFELTPKLCTFRYKAVNVPEKVLLFFAFLFLSCKHVDQV
jgi:hypothetical protein